jgi:hypothetical protein
MRAGSTTAESLRPTGLRLNPGPAGRTTLNRQHPSEHSDGRPGRRRVVVVRLGIWLGLLLQFVLLGGCGRGDEIAPQSLLPESYLTETTTYKNLVYARTSAKLIDLHRLLKKFHQVHGCLPATLLELEEIIVANPERTSAFVGDFYRISHDKAEDYRYVYRPGQPEPLLVALPRDSARMPLSLGINNMETYWPSAEPTDGQIPNARLKWRVPLVLVTRLSKHAAAQGFSLRALQGLWKLQEAQASYAQLHDGRHASSLHELTEARPPARFPLLLERDLMSSEEAASVPTAYTFSFGQDDHGWWAEAFPANLDVALACKPCEEEDDSSAEPQRPAAAPSMQGQQGGCRHPCYKFRVGQNQPLSFARLDGSDDWRPITELP